MPFTVDTTRFDLVDFDSTLTRYKKKFVMITEPCIGTKWPDWEYLTKGKTKDIFIKNSDGQYLINKVWPGKCHYIDFFHPNSKSYWEEAHKSLYEKIKFSGMWLDMSEPAAFSPGQVDEYDNVLSCKDTNQYPYLPGGTKFETATICPNAIHYEGISHIKLHNYYPNQQSMITYQFLEKIFPDHFPFILSRANAPGIGRYAALWSGDNYGRYSFYKLSVSEVMNANLFGVPMMGADICGFGENTPEILCAKWYQMGSLYPFSRSHAHLDSYRKEPFMMGKTLLETTKKSLEFRYSILKYYYSLFMLNNGTGTIFRPLFFEFYQDPECLENHVIDNSFMIGSALLVVPNFNEVDSLTESFGYFPYGQWYDLRDRTRVKKLSYNGQYIEVNTRLNEMPAVFLRSGKTIYTNNINKVLNSYDLNNDFNILISLEDSMNGWEATSIGLIPALQNYNSRSEVENCMKNNCYIEIKSSFNKPTGNLEIKFSKPKWQNENYQGFKIKEIVVLGMFTNKGNNIKLTNLEELIKVPEGDSNAKYYFEKKTDDCYTIKINGDLKVIENFNITISFG